MIDYFAHIVKSIQNTYKDEQCTFKLNNSDNIIVTFQKSGIKFALFPYESCEHALDRIKLMFDARVGHNIVSANRHYKI